MDVRIFTLGFKNRVESKEYLKFKIRPNKGLKVEQITIADLMTLSDTSQLAGGGGNIGNRKKRKVPKIEDETIESGRPRKTSSRPYTPELASPRAFQPRQSQQTKFGPSQSFNQTAQFSYQQASPYQPYQNISSYTPIPNL